jgi:hypothetical protein
MGRLWCIDVGDYPKEHPIHKKESD